MPAMPDDFEFVGLWDHCKTAPCAVDLSGIVDVFDRARQSVVGGGLLVFPSGEGE